MIPKILRPSQLHTGSGGLASMLYDLILGYKKAFIFRKCRKTETSAWSSIL
ncbi:hypothetical protein ERICIV_02949 [Paenibacillus larvae subsp. larvae]|uniref:Uncharacterized protein n=1 Tax=Paenibacillus larvae subsp. larvae TaxID=147375 RepID=A0A2L1UFY2_9BACL|nr:hypothetical protein ERICIII_03048 [Paenibacillus larvae subsp. larvae]AVF31836.1 hypothetical protein ERICIV_02949 [Paenibacillus larvae subsp. larvae]AVG12722.1 hypothetical protein ERICII_02355 [Paenibacillus larvae subsp. larvae DSM 25430]QHZ52514.1 hypothetical protein ERICV_03403 [Paenibacillus larvae subsp. larvae]